MRRPLRQRGFNLTELLVSIVILGVLGGVASTVYTQQTTKARYSDARTALQAAALEMRDCKAERLTYTGCSPSGDESQEGYYALAASVAEDGESFSLTATPVTGTQQADDTDCGVFSLSSSGEKTSSGGKASCW